MIDSDMKMAVSRAMIGTLSAAIIACVFFAVPAKACSDLPNICAAQAQHNQQMTDIAAAPQQQGNNGQRGDNSAPAPPRDPMAAAMADIYNAGQATLVAGYRA